MAQKVFEFFAGIASFFVSFVVGCILLAVFSFVLGWGITNIFFWVIFLVIWGAMFWFGCIGPAVLGVVLFIMMFREKTETSDSGYDGPSPLSVQYHYDRDGKYTGKTETRPD